MQGDIAKAWTTIKAKRDADLAGRDQDIAALKAQITADGINDDDRAAIADMQKEAGV